MKRIILIASIVLLGLSCTAQSPLTIPPLMLGPVFDLSVQTGTTQFWPGINTPTFGVNGNILAPTLILNKGESVTLNVTNNLNTTTTMHWHGLHVASMNDGGPHQIIQEGATWSPQFEVLNNAGTFWYHPHGENKTDMQVSKGIAGMIIIKDDVESVLELPRTYGVDDFPIIVQTKSFDVLHQIQIATHADTLLMVNGTVNPYLNAPAQVVRFRLLNGSSERSYLFGFSNDLPFSQDMPFSQIATDGGLKETPYETTRLRLSPGERCEILLDLSTYQDATIYLNNYGSDLPDGILGAENVGVMASLDGYDENPLNGSDFQVLQINVVQATANPILSIPATLTSITPISVGEVDVERTMLLNAMEMGPMNMVEGPFGINSVQFDMDIVNEIVQLGDIELWTLTNQTQIAHPFHIHDVEFQIIDFNGGTPPPDQQGWKDVVLVMPEQSVSFITRFEDFADPMTPYMYHCHLLHHEDEGMMGSFIVVDPNDLVEWNEGAKMVLFPNPASSAITIQLDDKFDSKKTLQLFDAIGNAVKTNYFVQNDKIILECEHLNLGIYSVVIEGIGLVRFIKN